MISQAQWINDKYFDMRSPSYITRKPLPIPLQSKGWSLQTTPHSTNKKPSFYSYFVIDLKLNDGAADSNKNTEQK